MSLSQATFEAPTWAAEFALVKDELLLAVRRHVVVDALFSFALIVLPMVGLVLARTRWGKAMRALSDNRALASVSGIDVDRATAFTWMLGAGLAGLGGVLLGLVQNSFYPNTGFSILPPEDNHFAVKNVSLFGRRKFQIAPL